MSEYIAFDSHKRYTWVDREDHSTRSYCTTLRKTIMKQAI